MKTINGESQGSSLLEINVVNWREHQNLKPATIHNGLIPKFQN